MSPRSDPRRKSESGGFGSSPPRLRGIDLTIARGEMFALIGPDGAGKTTFFRIVAGLLAPTSGRAVRDDVPFGLVPQRFSLYGDLTVDENLALRAQLYSVPPAEGEARARDLLARVGLDRFGTRLAGALSGGMKQKLARRGAPDAPRAPPPRRADDRRRPGLAPRVAGGSERPPPRRAHDRRLDAPTWTGRIRPRASPSSTRGGSWPSGTRDEILALTYPADNVIARADTGRRLRLPQ